MQTCKQHLIYGPDSLCMVHFKLCGDKVCFEKTHAQ